MDRHDSAFGPISQALADDHRRLEALLDRATAVAGRIDRALFEQFRAGLLRHIGVEEKILLPAARRVRGSPLPVAHQLRLDHGAIAAMLVPTPTPSLVLRLRALLEVHDELEEGPGGVYEACDTLLASEATQLLLEIHEYPAVRTSPHNDGPLVEQHIVDSLNRAGRAALPARPGGATFAGPHT